jgi:hypothetical protein
VNKSHLLVSGETFGCSGHVFMSLCSDGKVVVEMRLMTQKTGTNEEREEVESEGQGLGAQSVTCQLREIGKFTVFGG